MPERRFRDMSLTELDLFDMTPSIVRRIATARMKRGAKWDWKVTGPVLDRAKRLLPLWRQWAIERERLWFAMLGLGLDIEGDDWGMPRHEMRARIERMANAHVTAYKPHKSAAQNILRELDR